MAFRDHFRWCRKLGVALGALLAILALLSMLPAAGIAREPAPELLQALDQEADGAVLARSAERMLRDHRSHPRAGEAAEILAELAYARGEYATAGRHFQTAAELARDDGEANRRRLWRGRALAAAGDVAGARKQFEELAGKGPIAAEATLGLADVALAEGKAPRAIELYESLTSRSSPAGIRPLALGQLAVAYERAGREDQALATSRELVSAYPAATEAAAARERIRRAAKRASEGKAVRELPPPPPRERRSDGVTAGKGSGSAASAKPEKSPTAPPASSPKATHAKTAVDESPSRGSESATESGTSAGYSLQLGAFGDRANAADLARRIESFGLESVRIEEEMRGSRRFFLVRAGAYPDRERAERDGERLLAEQGIAYRIVER
jgi:tetratricopeptide (TPR) repeat protein